MADEPINPNVEEEVEDQSQPPEVQDEHQEENAPLEQEEQEEQQDDTEEEVPEEKPPSRREQLRIQTLLEKYGPPEERRRSAPSQENLDYEAELNADPETRKLLEQDRQNFGKNQYNAGLEQAKTIQFHTRLEVDAPQVEAKYKFLNSHDEKFDPVRANAMNQLYLQSVGYDPGDAQRGIPESVTNPNVRYRDFVEAQMEFAEALLADRQVETSKNVARQAAQTGIRPDGSSAKRLDLTKDPKDMSTEELYAVIGGEKPPKSK